MSSSVVLITGASSGIGAALARAYAARGARLVLLARRLDRLEALLRHAPQGALAVAADVTRDGDIEHAVEQALGKFGQLDTVIANAGFGVRGTVQSLSLDDYRRQFETNVFGVLRTVKATLAPLKRSKGRIAIVGSINGYVVTPGWSAYAMSKFAVRALSETLGIELSEAGISVTHVAPGFIESEFRRVDSHGVFQSKSTEPMPSLLVVPVDVAAEQMVRGIEARRPEVIVSLHGKLAQALARYAPGAVRTVLRLSAGHMLKLGERFGGIE